MFHFDNSRLLPTNSSNSCLPCSIRSAFCSIKLSNASCVKNMFYVYFAYNIDKLLSIDNGKKVCGAPSTSQKYWSVVRRRKRSSNSNNINKKNC